jgi:hypothetical protein
MTEKAKTHRKENTTERTTSETAETARRNYEQALRTGQRFQEEAGQWWTRMLSQTAMAADWQKQFENLTSLSTRVMPLAQRRMEEMMDLVEKNGRTSAELMRKAVEAAQTPAIAESQAKWMEFWTSSMRAVQANFEEFSEISTHAIDSWIEFIRKNTETTELRVPKTA